MTRRKDAPPPDDNDSQAAPATLQGAQLNIEQMLALLEMPAPPTPVQYRGVNGGLIHALQDLLSPLRAAAPELAVDKIAAVLGFPGPSDESKGMTAYTAAANTALQMADRLAQLTRETLPGSDQTALAVAQECAEKLSKSDQSDIVLRVRKKRRSCMSREKKGTSGAPPSELTFEPHGTWVDTVEKEAADTSPRAAVASLVSAFNSAMRRQVELERTAVQGARNRVRAWVASWDVGGEIHVELRDIALIAIGVDESDGVRVTRINVLAPTERTESASGTSRTLLPSRYAYYRELSDHLLVHALRRDMPWVRSLATTLLHCAGLATLYDPLPDACAGRVATATLDPRQLIDRATCVVWKWCYVPRVEALPPAWYAFTPVMIP
ncbi:hypothetical protein MCUN1_000433 [Malassezia cuniculi]|uniref:Uncharacterized protein n=1 Tax=Malassezia cuniculi TaxID=948313 RepID=A0AAF0ER94_9BASI|nr:hypothetical protein MCUN1_000433 [Malassezia cuniculi]